MSRYYDNFSLDQYAEYPRQPAPQQYRRQQQGFIERPPPSYNSQVRYNERMAPAPAAHFFASSPGLEEKSTVRSEVNFREESPSFERALRPSRKMEEGDLKPSSWLESHAKKHNRSLCIRWSLAILVLLGIVGGVVYRFSTSHEDSVATTPIAPSLNGFNGGYTSDPFAQATTIHSTAAASLPTRPPTPVSSVPHSSSTSRLIR